MMLQRIQELYDAGAVKRKHTMTTQRVHTVAEHVYGSLIIANELIMANEIKRSERATFLALNPYRVMVTLLYHDAPEVQTGDVPAPVKRASSAVKATYDEMESSFYNRLEMEMPDCNDLEEAIVKASDTLDLSCTCLRERILGNRSLRLEDVFSNTMSYIQDQEWVTGVAEISTFLKESWKNV